MIKIFNIYITTKKEIERFRDDCTISIFNAFRANGKSLTQQQMLSIKRNLSIGFKLEKCKLKKECGAKTND